MTVTKTVTTEIKGLYFKGEIEDKGADTKFVLRNFIIPSNKVPSKLPQLTLEEVEVMISEMNEIRDTLKNVIPTIPLKVSLLDANDPKVLEMAGASEAISTLDVVIEGDTYKISGEGKVVNQFEWFYGDTNEVDDGIYIALEFTPPSNVEDISKAKFKGKNLDGSDKISDYRGLMVLLINANNINTGRTIEFAWDGENFTDKVVLDYSGITGLTVE